MNGRQFKTDDVEPVSSEFDVRFRKLGSVKSGISRRHFSDLASGAPVEFVVKSEIAVVKKLVNPRTARAAKRFSRADYRRTRARIAAVFAKQSLGLRFFFYFHKTMANSFGGVAHPMTEVIILGACQAPLLLKKISPFAAANARVLAVRVSRASKKPNSKNSAL